MWIGLHIAEKCLNAIQHPRQLGGPGKTVEIDESKFGKRKFYRGHHVEGCWVFGGIERESGKVFMEIVDKRLLLNEIYTFLFKETPLLLSHWLRNG